MSRPILHASYTNHSGADLLSKSDFKLIQSIFFLKKTQTYTNVESCFQVLQLLLMLGYMYQSIKHCTYVESSMEQTRISYKIWEEVLD